MTTTTPSATTAPADTEIRHGGAPEGVDATDWRRTAVVYQIYPRSFADSDGDGIGDLPGITAHLGDLADLGVDAVWLSPFYTSPQADAGYDVADYRDVDPLFGTLADFDALLTRTHELGMKLVVDLVPNHSSDEHPWFQAALAAPPGSPERERYIFRDGSGPDGSLPPNNWPSMFRGPAWTRTTNADGTPGQWYLHLFDTKQPDWNWENPEIREEFVSVLRFWLDRGVDGFRVDVANSMIKDPALPDVALDADGYPAGHFSSPDGESEIEGMLSPYLDLDGVHEVYRSWRTVLDDYTPGRMLVAEAWVQPLSRLALYVRPDEMDQAFNFDFLAAPWDAATLRSVITASMSSNDSVGAPTTWVLSNHDVVRHATRFGLRRAGGLHAGIRAVDEQPDAVLGLRRARAATLLMLALPGSAYLYQGEELGLPEHTDLDDDLRQDPTWWRSGHTEAGRDGCRVPVPWVGDAPGAGFGPTGLTWLPQPASYARLARDKQEGVPGSTLEMYKAALAERARYGLGAGALSWEPAPGENAVALRNGAIRAVCNTGDTPIPLPAGEVVVASVELPGDGTLPGNAAVWVS